MIRVTDHIAIPEGELHFDFVRASGPGGQRRDRAATAVQLRFDLRGSPALPELVRRRLQRLARNRINQDGELIIEAKRHRSQERNRQEAVQRLVELVRRAARPPKRRIKTKPSKAAEQRRLEQKRRRSQKKKRRRYDPYRRGDV